MTLIMRIFFALFAAGVTIRKNNAPDAPELVADLKKQSAIEGLELVENRKSGKEADAEDTIPDLVDDLKEKDSAIEGLELVESRKSGNEADAEDTIPNILDDLKEKNSSIEVQDPCASADSCDLDKIDVLASNPDLIPAANKLMTLRCAMFLSDDIVRLYRKDPEKTWTRIWSRQIAPGTMELKAGNFFMYRFPNSLTTIPDSQKNSPAGQASKWSRLWIGSSEDAHEKAKQAARVELSGSCRLRLFDSKNNSFFFTSEIPSGQER